jgi:hypothetical protein
MIPCDHIKNEAGLLLDKDEMDSTARTGILWSLLQQHQQTGKCRLLLLINLYIGKILSSLRYVNERIVSDTDSSGHHLELISIFNTLAIYFQNPSFYYIVQKLGENQLYLPLPGTDHFAAKRDKAHAFPYIGLDVPGIAKHILANSYRRTLDLLENFYPGELNRLLTQAPVSLAAFVEKLADDRLPGELIKEVYRIEKTKCQMSEICHSPGGGNGLHLSRLLCLDEEKFYSVQLRISPLAQIIKTHFNPDLNNYSELAKKNTEKKPRTIVLIPGWYNEAINEKRVTEIFDLGYQQEGSIKEYNLDVPTGELLQHFLQAGTVESAIRLFESEVLVAPVIMNTIRHLLCEGILESK